MEHCWFYSGVPLAHAHTSVILNLTFQTWCCQRSYVDLEFWLAFCCGPFVLYKVQLVKIMLCLVSDVQNDSILFLKFTRSPGSNFHNDLRSRLMFVMRIRRRALSSTYLTNLKQIAIFCKYALNHSFRQLMLSCLQKFEVAYQIRSTRTHSIYKK